MAKTAAKTNMYHINLLNRSLRSLVEDSKWIPEKDVAVSSKVYRDLTTYFPEELVNIINNWPSTHELAKGVTNILPAMFMTARPVGDRFDNLFNGVLYDPAKPIIEKRKQVFYANDDNNETLPVVEITSFVNASSCITVSRIGLAGELFYISLHPYIKIYKNTNHIIGEEHEEMVIGIKEVQTGLTGGQTVRSDKHWGRYMRGVSDIEDKLIEVIKTSMPYTNSSTADMPF